MSDLSQSDDSRRVGRTAPLWAVIVIGIAALLVGLLGGALLLQALQAGTSAKLAEVESQNATLTARVDALTASLTVAASQVATLMFFLGKEYTIAETEDPRFIPGRQARIIHKGDPIGIFGEVHPRVLEAWNIAMPCVAAELDLDSLLG